MQSENIKYLIDKDALLIFTSAGEANALLYMKARQAKQLNAYLTGHLIGSSDADIQAFYRKNHGKNWEILLEKEKKESLQWITQNMRDIQTWAQKQGFTQCPVSYEPTIKSVKQSHDNHFKKDAQDVTQKAHASKQRLEDIEQTLIKEFNPTIDRCRPGKRDGGIGDSILSNPKGVLACIITGFKPLVWVGLSWNSLQQKLGNDLIALMHEKNVKYIVDRGIMFKNNQLTNAQLLYRAFKTRHFNEYLMSHLSGVSDKDIMALYGQETKKYESDKKDSLDWIEKNNATTNEWFIKSKSIIQ